MERKYVTNPCYLHRKIAGEDILISVGGNIANFNGYVRLNATSSFLWDRMTDAKTVEQLIAALVSEFEVSEDLARKDVTELIQTLLEKEMILEV